MENVINRATYDFEPDVVRALADVDGQSVPVDILGKPRYFVCRKIHNADGTSKLVVFDVVSEQYEGMNHAVVVDSVKRDIIPKLRWKIIEEVSRVWMDGGIMFYSMKTANTFDISGIKLYATINAVNSHNRFTKAGVHITLMDEEGTSYLPTVGTKSVYTYESMLHRKSTLDIIQLQKLVDNIPVVINSTISNWQHWTNAWVEFPRLYILAQLFNFRLGTYLIEKMPTGGSRFDMYKNICQFMLNNDKMSASGFNALTSMAKFVRIMKKDKFFECAPEELKNEIAGRTIFSWEDKVKSKEEKQEENKIDVADIGEEKVTIEEVIVPTDEILEDLL